MVHFTKYHEMIVPAGRRFCRAYSVTGLFYLKIYRQLTHTNAPAAASMYHAGVAVHTHYSVVGCGSSPRFHHYLLTVVIVLKVAVNTIVPRSPFFLFLYLKTQTVTHIRKNAVEYLRQWNGAICVIYNLCQRQKIR